MTGKPLTYRDAGINYEQMDPFKIACQKAAAETAFNLEGFGFRELTWSRGESAYVVDMGNGDTFGHVQEGLGTKNLVADAMRRKPGEKSHYECVGIDTVAMIVNDLVTLGIMPATVAMHLAVGSSDWFDDERRCQDLIRGWRMGCEAARATWGGGETPTLKGVIDPSAAELSGSAVGFAKRDTLFAGNIKDGDIIVLFRSSGIHANGLTLARKIAEQLPEGYEMPIGSDNITYGEALLTPTEIYVQKVKRFLDAGAKPHYAVNITGHGWRKLMRSPLPFAYVIDNMPEPQSVFDFIQKHAHLDDREMYGTYNMGAGFALYFSRDDREIVQEICEREDHIMAGHVSASDSRRVLIKPKDIEFIGEELKVR